MVEINSSLSKRNVVCECVSAEIFSYIQILYVRKNKQQFNFVNKNLDRVIKKMFNMDME